MAHRGSNNIKCRVLVDGVETVQGSPIISARERERHSQQYDQNSHTKQSPYALHRMIVQMVSEKCQTGQMRKTGKPGQVDDNHPVEGRKALGKLCISAYEYRESSYNLEVTHCKDAL
jgi:hypothetical protein